MDNVKAQREAFAKIAAAMRLTLDAHVQGTPFVVIHTRLAADLFISAATAARLECSEDEMMPNWFAIELCEGHARRRHLRHNCMENAVPYESDGAIGHGFECGICKKFLQAG